WIRQFGTHNAVNNGGGVTVDGAGNVYLSGFINDQQAFVAKYDSSGSQLWMKQNLGGWGWRDTLDPSGNVLLTGSTSGSTSPGFVTKIDPNGNLLWSRPSVLSTTGRTVASDSTGNIYAAGGSVVKFDPNGNTILSIPTTNAWGVAAAPNGNI